MYYGVVLITGGVTGAAGALAEGAETTTDDATVVEV